VFTEMVAQYLPVLLEKEGDYLFEYKDGIVNLKNNPPIGALVEQD
jgi:hypothetical protein